MKDLLVSKYETLVEASDSVMSNLDHSIDREVEKELMDGLHFAQYAGWNFCGYVYYEVVEKRFVCEVWQYRELVEILRYRTLKLIMINVCEIYGSD